MGDPGKVVRIHIPGSDNDEQDTSYIIPVNNIIYLESHYFPKPQKENNSESNSDSSKKVQRLILYIKDKPSISVNNEKKRFTIFVTEGEDILASFESIEEFEIFFMQACIEEKGAGCMPDC